MRSTRLFRSVAAVLAATTATLALSITGAEATGNPKPVKTVDLRVLSINDFHGNLQPPAGSSGRVTSDNGTVVDAGGGAYLATHVKLAKAEVNNSVLVAAGDLIGASPLASALFHDEPTIKLLNYLGLYASAAGNHEFDEGYKELLRIQLGGCHPVDGCVFEPTYKGSKFPYLGANVTRTNGLPALLPFALKLVEGIPVAMIGAPLKDTPTIITAEAAAGLKFGDEVAAINRTSKLLDRFGVKSQIVLLHQGDNVLPGGPNACNVAPGGEGTRIATAVSPSVDAVFSGHSHQGYNCVVTDPAGNPRTVTQGSSFGRLLTVLDLKIDRKTRDVVRSASVADNRIVTRTVPADAGAQAIVDQAVTKSAPIANQQVGTISADILRAAAPSGESPLGNLIADAQLAATASSGAVVAITNPGGVRADLTFASSPAGEGNGVVTYGEAFTVQPFANIMQTITLTGAQLKAVLEQQFVGFQGQTVERILQISAGLTYTRSLSAPIGSKVTNLAINGTPVDPAAPYRVAANNFLVGGGDGFTTFTAGTNITGGPIDLDAFTAYLTANPGIAPPATNRITLVP